MSKISEVVKLKTGYANFVNLKGDFEKSQENAERMAMYRPTKSHRESLERLCRGLYQPNDKKFYLLSGSYGTGKSHLCLMFANLLSRSSGDPEIKGFYENYQKLNPEKARELKNIRKDGQYLVAICDYYSGRRFEDTVLKAVLEACQEKGLESALLTEFDEAERCLDDWEKKRKAGGGRTIRDFYQDFEKALERIAPGLALEQLRTNLRGFLSESLETFRRAFRETMGGIEFQAKSGNLIPILKRLIQGKNFKERFKGLAIFFDEFGFTLEKSAYSKDVLQGFMETICKNEPNVLFVGCIHKDFKSYADRFSQADAAVMEARITQVNLLNEGIEEIIGAIVETEKESTTWKKEVEPKTGIFDQLVPVCASLKLFPWIEEVARIRQRVLEDIFAVHPMALSCLLKLSSEIGSDARSTFTFFSGGTGDVQGSYADFIEKEEITAAGGKLNLYTVDRLFSFFENELSLKNISLKDRQRQLVNGYYASLEVIGKSVQGELFKDQEDQYQAILRMILIYQLSQIPTNLDNLRFGLYCLTKPEEKQIEKDLKTLAKWGAIFYRAQSSTYELALGTGEDPQDLIDRYIGNPTLHPPDMVKAFKDEAGRHRDLEFLEAKQYNLPYGEDKRFRTYFIRAKNLNGSLWKEIEDEREASNIKEMKSYEGSVVYVLCEEEAEIQIAQRATQEIPEIPITVAIPHGPLPFGDLLLRVKACRHYLPPNEAMKISAQTESRLRDFLENVQDGYLTQLQQVMDSILNGDTSCWYVSQGRVIIDRPQQPHKAVDMICEELFKNRSRIKHADLNFIHDDKWRSGKNNSLKQAVSTLLEAERVLIDNGNPENHGQRRYLEKVLLKGAGALRKTRTEGKVTFFECENDPSKISDDFPVLKTLCLKISGLKAGKGLPVAAVLGDLRIPPYGAGGNALMLSFAHAIRAFGEQLRIFKDSTKISEIFVRNYEDILPLVGDPFSKAILEIREISIPEQILIDGMAKSLQAPPLAHGEKRTVTETYELLRTWWKNIPSIARVLDLYEKKEQDRIAKLMKALDQIYEIDRFSFCLGKIPEIYGWEHPSKEEAASIISEFEKDIHLIQQAEQRAAGRVAEEVCLIFGAKGDIVICKEMVTSWYQGLNPSQRQAYKFKEPDAQSLLKAIGNEKVPFEIALLKNLPEAFGLDSMEEWTSLRTVDYVAKIKQAKRIIEEAKAEVPKPDVESKSYEIKTGETLKVEIPQGGTDVIYTINGVDPRKTTETFSMRERGDLTQWLKNKPSVEISMVTMDGEGNYSEPVRIELINQAAKFNIQVEKELFEDKGSFLFPETSEGIIAVIQSLLGLAIKRKIIEPTQIKTLLDEIKNIVDKADKKTTNE